MLIKLAYKEYPFKMSLNACKAFHQSTGLDLQILLLEYISKCAQSGELGMIDRVLAFSKVCDRGVASKALHALIDEATDGVSLAEIEDATYRAGWAINTSDSDFSEPWGMVMLDVALQVNEYYTANMGESKKKVVT